jgi:large repetitive protein
MSIRFAPFTVGSYTPPAYGPPGAPTTPVATAGNASATVVCSATTQGGSAITQFTATSNPGGIQGSSSTGTILVTGLANGTAYTFTVVATNSFGSGPASSASNSVTPTAATNFPVYQNGTLSSSWPSSPVLSFSVTLNYSYSGTTPPPCPGSTSSLQCATTSVFGGGWQPSTIWTTIPPNGFDDRIYTQMSFSLYTPNPNSMYVSSHYSRATGNDIGASASLTQGSTSLNIPANTWTTVGPFPLSNLAMLGQANGYKFAIGANQQITYYVDNVVLIPGNLAWAFQGTGAPAAGWIDASTGGSADYTWLPNTLGSSLYSLNNPANPSSVFTASCTGNQMTVSALTSGSINIGDTACWQANLGGSSAPTILSGTYPVYTLSSSQTVASQPWASAPAQSKLTGCKLTGTVVNSTLKLTNASFSVTPYTTFTFGVIPTKSGYGYAIQFLNTSGVPVGNVVNTSSSTTQHDFGISTSSFTVHNILLSLFGSIGSSIGGFTIQETSSNATNVTYFSAIGFLA